MTRKTVLKRFLPVLLILVLIVCAVVIFSKCSKSQNVPYGNINDEKYFSYKLGNDTISISNKELYDNMRYKAYDPVVNKIENAIFQDYITKVKEEIKDKNSDQYKDLIVTIKSDVFGVSEDRDIKKLETKDIKSAIDKFYDTLHTNGYESQKLYGYNLNTDYDLNKLLSSEGLYSDCVFESYYLALAKTKYAKEQLLKEIADENSDYYVDFEEENRNQYDASLQNQGDVKALIVKFETKTNAEKALMQLELKFVKGNLYSFPRKSGLTDEQYENEYENATTDEMNAINDEKAILLEYVRLYNATYQYRDPIILKNDKVINMATSLNEIITIADTYESKQELINDILNNDQAYEKDENDEYILNVDGDKLTNDQLNKNVFSYTYDELSSYDSSICSYVYETLSADTYIDAANKVSSDFYEDKFQSTPKEQAASSGYFFAYKFEDCIPFEFDELKRLAENEETKAEWEKIYKDAIEKDVYDSIIDTNLTTTYINEKVSDLYKKLYEDKSLLIYDPLIQTFYKYNNSDYSKTSKKSNTDVLKLTFSYTGTSDEDVHNVDYTLTADELFEKLKRLYGPTTAYDLSTAKILESLYADKLTDTDLSDINEELETLLASFSQGGMESSGFPASIGKQTFLEVYLNVSSSKEAIEKVYKRSKYEELLFEDMTIQAKLFNYAGYSDSEFFGSLVDKENENVKDNLYKVFAQLAKNYYDDFTSLRYKNILIYTDLNEDGKHDDPKDYYVDPATATEGQKKYSYTDKNSNTITGLTLSEYLRNLTAELMNLIIDEVASSKTVEDGLTKVSKEFEAASQYSTNKDDNESLKYGKFKKAGLKLTIESETSSTNASSLVKPFLDNIDDFYNSIIKDDKNDSKGWKNEIYASAIKYTKYYDENLTVERKATPDTLLETEYGYHALYVTGYEEPTSSKWNYETDNVTIQGEKVYSEIYNNKDNEYPSVAQIKAFVEEHKDGYESLPSVVQTGIQASFADEYTKYTEATFKSYLTHLLISNVYDAKFEKAEDSEIMTRNLISIRNSIDSYTTDENTKLWWSIFS